MTITQGDVKFASAAALSLSGYLLNKDVIGFTGLAPELFFPLIYGSFGYFVAKIGLDYLKDADKRINGAWDFMKSEPLISAFVIFSYFVLGMVSLFIFEFLIYPFVAPFLALYPPLNNFFYRLTPSNPFMMATLAWMSFVGFFFAYSIFSYPVLALLQASHKLLGTPKPNDDPVHHKYGGRGSDTKYGIAYLMQDSIQLMIAMPMTFFCAFWNAFHKHEYNEIPQIPLTFYTFAAHKFGDVVLDVTYLTKTAFRFPHWLDIFDCPKVLISNKPQNP